MSSNDETSEIIKYEVGELKAKDDDGTVHILHPVTKIEAVLDLIETLDNMKKFIIEELNKKVTGTDIIDNLLSTSITSPLSANQGRVLNSELLDTSQFPDGTRFYPDIKNGIRGYNTSAARGADTFFPFLDTSKVQEIGNNSTYILFAGNKSLSASFNTGNFTIIVVVCWTKGGSGYITGEASISNIVKKIIKNNDSACDLSICQVNKNKSCTASFTKYQPTNDYTTMAIKVYGIV